MTLRFAKSKGGCVPNLFHCFKRAQDRFSFLFKIVVSILGLVYIVSKTLLLYLFNL